MGIDAEANTATGLVTTREYLQHSYRETMALCDLPVWRDLVPEVVWQDASIYDPVWTVEGLIVYWWKTLLNLSPIDASTRDDWWEDNWNESRVIEPVDEGRWEISVPDHTGPVWWDCMPSASAPPSLDELTSLLCLRCDMGTGSIDPTPLSELCRALSDVLNGETEDRESTEADLAEDRFFALFPIACGVIRRIEECARYEDSDRRITEYENKQETLLKSRLSHKKRLRPRAGNEKRDEWLYAQRLAGMPLQDISDRLRTEHPEWYPIHNRQGISAALDRYCKRTGHPIPEGNAQ